ncbi:hypothetical protein [Leptospira haakeii]|uniref:PH domain-containing protein n=1 Tax=Leptospira haakeii TaxID=2023198 RepID=A0ABX4PP32_9LEPT|nr:hypothetical protein [Leptospira haakeii]PKA16138.1 hypothetical protein CH363_08295 [Leptospira haakeii]PKA18086.1 hypothetical protein CH377_19485 [Leptospira haakeii]
MQKYSKVIAYSGNDIKHTFSLSVGIILLLISFILFVGRAKGIILSVTFFSGLFLISYAIFRLNDRKRWIVTSNNDSIQLFEISGINKSIKLTEIEKFYFGGVNESSKSILKLYLQRNESIRIVGDLFESDIKQLYQFLKSYSEVNPILREIESPVKLTAQWLVGFMLGAPLFILLYILAKAIFVK